MITLIDKLYEPERYGLVEVAVEVQAVIDDRDIWKKACELINDHLYRKTNEMIGDPDIWYEYARRAIKAESTHPAQ